MSWCVTQEFLKMHLSWKQEKEEQHQLAVTAYLKNSRKEHQRILARRQTIEERKERLESLNIQREKEELEQREAELQKVRKAEEERLRQEAKEREKERILQEHEQIKKKTVRERLEQIKKTELGAKAFKDIDIEVCNTLLLNLNPHLRSIVLYCLLITLGRLVVFTPFGTADPLLCEVNIVFNGSAVFNPC